MTNIPPIDFFIAAGTKNIDGKDGWDDMADWMRESPWGGIPETYTIAAGVITPAAQKPRIIKLRTQGGTPTDTLDRIATDNIPDGGWTLVMAELQAERPLLSHGNGGNGGMFFKDGQNLNLTTPNIAVLLRRQGITHQEIATFKPVVAVSAFNQTGQAPGPLAAQIDLEDIDISVGTTFTGSTFTPDVAGLYRISAALRWTGTTAAFDHQVQIRKNASTIVAYEEKRVPANGVPVTTAAEAIVSLDGVADSIEIYGLGDSSALVSADRASYLAISRVG